MRKPRVSSTSALVARSRRDNAVLGGRVDLRPPRRACERLVDCVLEELPGLSVSCALVNDHANSLGHLQRMSALEDVAAHVNAACTLADDVVSKVQSVALSKLLATSDNKWSWACCNNFLEVLADGRGCSRDRSRGRN